MRCTLYWKEAFADLRVAKAFAVNCNRILVAAAVSQVAKYGESDYECIIFPVRPNPTRPIMAHSYTVRPSVVLREAYRRCRMLVTRKMMGNSIY